MDQIWRVRKREISRVAPMFLALATEYMETPFTKMGKTGWTTGIGIMDVGRSSVYRCGVGVIWVISKERRHCGSTFECSGEFWLRDICRISAYQMMILKDMEVDMLWEKVQSEKRRAQERQYLETRERRRSSKSMEKGSEAQEENRESSRLPREEQVNK